MNVTLLFNSSHLAQSSLIKWQLNVLLKKKKKVPIKCCGGSFVLLGFNLSCYTTAHDSEVGELRLAYVKHNLGQLVRKLGHPSINAPW